MDTAIATMITCQVSDTSISDDPQRGPVGLTAEVGGCACLNRRREGICFYTARPKGCGEVGLTAEVGGYAGLNHALTGMVTTWGHLSLRT